MHDAIFVPPKLAEIKLRAERRAGELLAEMVKPGNPQFFHDERIEYPKLDELGITRIQSHHWQAGSKEKTQFCRHFADKLVSTQWHRVAQPDTNRVAVADEATQNRIWGNRVAHQVSD